MKVGLRIVVILISVGIVIYALIPPSESENRASTPEATPDPSPAESNPGLIRDFLGGAQLDAGSKAKETIKEVEEKSRRDFEELGL